MKYSGRYSGRENTAPHEPGQGNPHRKHELVMKYSGRYSGTENTAPHKVHEPCQGNPHRH